MCVWTTAFLEAFKKEQVTCAMKWGMVGYEDQELPPRPEFRANTVDNVLINNPINGREQLYFPEEEAARRLKISYAIIAVIIFFVILGVMIVFFVKALVDPNQCIKKIVEDDPPDGYDDFVKGHRTASRRCCALKPQFCSMWQFHQCSELFRKFRWEPRLRGL